MATQYNIDEFIRGINAFGTLFCDAVYTTTLQASTDASVTCPSFAPMGAPNATTYNKWVAVIKSTAADNVYCALNTTAAVPVGHTFASSTSELLHPLDAKLVKSGDVLHFISAGTPDVSVAFYSIQE